MKIMNKYEKDDITKRLKLSDNVTWDLLSEKQKEDVVNKYYHWNDIENIGLNKVLETNLDTRKNFGFLFLGASFGLAANIIVSILFRHLNNNLFDFSFLILAFGGLFLIMKEIQKTTFEDLKNNKVLNYLLNMVEQDNKAEMEKKK